MLLRHSEPVCAFGQRGHVLFSITLLELAKVGFPMPKLAMVRRVIEAEQETDIAVDLGGGAVCVTICARAGTTQPLLGR